MKTKHNDNMGKHEKVTNIFICKMFEEENEK